MSCQDVVAFSRNFQFAKENKSYILGCTFKILKCPVQTNKETACTPKKLSCGWFQEPEFNETCSLILPNVQELVRVNKRLPAQQKNANISILTGKTVKVAYLLVDNPNFDKRVLTSTENKEKSGEGKLKAHRFNRLEVLVSVTQSGNQKDVRRLTEVLSQQCNLTGEKIIEISHYFDRQGIKDEKEPADGENNQASGEQPVKMKEAQVILRKLANDGLLKEKERKTTKSRLRMRKRRLESVDKNDDKNEPIPPCSLSKSPRIDDKSASEVLTGSQILHVKDLSLKQLDEFFERNSTYLWAIYKGETECKRHATYMSGSARQKRQLDFQVNLTFYHEEQVEHAIALLKTLLAPDGDKKTDYILRVLLPEFLIKVYMDLKGVDQDLAERKMQPCGDIRNIESPVKYT